MKKIFLIPGLAILMIACHSGTDKKAELENLKKQEADLKSKISGLEADLNKGNDTSAKGTNVSIMPLKTEIFKNYIDIQGHVDAEENVNLSTEMPGTITKINVKVGDEVTKGQVLAETDARAINQSIADLQVNMELVNQMFDKQKNLWDQKIGTEVQFLQAKTNKESMQKKLEQLQQQLSMSKIISPIDGNVDAVDIKIGQLVAPGMPAIRVINLANLKVKADVAESYASKIKKGSEVIIRFPDNSDSLNTKVSFVSHSINVNSRTFNVEVLLDNKKEYHPNMIARLSINDYQSATPVIVVPINVIQKDENGAPFVFLAEGNIAKKQLVTVGKQYNGKSEITAGLKVTDALIEKGGDLLNDGDPIVYKK